MILLYTTGYPALSHAQDFTHAVINVRKIAMYAAVAVNMSYPQLHFLVAIHILPSVELQC